MPSMTKRYWRKKAILFKIEPTYGVDAVPTGGANAMETRNFSIEPMKNRTAEQNIEQAFMGNQQEIVVGTSVAVQFEVGITGSGTAGVAPAYGPLNRACGRSETALAAAQAGTAQAGGASTITLAVGASAVDDAYKNLTIRTTGGTGSGQSRVISGYVGATKVATVREAWTTPPDATTTYSIDAQVVYAPVSAAFEAGTMYVNIDGVLHKLLGVRGDRDLKLTGAGIPVYVYKFVGLYGGVTDAGLPALTMTAWKVPLGVNNVNTGAFSIDGFATNLYSLEVMSGNQVTHRDDIIGEEDVIIGDRKPTGSIIIQAPTQAEKDFYTLVKDATVVPITVTHGTAAGGKAKFDLLAQLKDPGYEEKNGITAMKFGLRLKPTSAGNDELIESIM